MGADQGPAPAAAALAGVLRGRLERHAGRYVGLAAGMHRDGTSATVGFGRTRAGGEVVPDERTSFQIGSITKVFTALLLADAVERGEVAPDQPATTLAPELATYPGARPITLEDLATHTSGLPRLPPGLRRQALRNRHDPYAAFTVDDLADALRHRPARAPGGRSRYSNFGAAVLGHVLGRATGRSYEELVATRVAAPLGLRATAVGPVTGSGPIAGGHTRRGRPTVDWHLPTLAGAGALRSTPEDLLTFLVAHLHPDATPLAAPIRAAMTPRVAAGRHLRVALGWHVLERRDAGPLWWHNGGTGGFFSFLALDPAARTGVVVLANSARSVDRLGMLLLAPERAERA